MTSINPDDRPEDIIRDFNTVGDRILGELQGIRGELHARPTRTEITVRRRAAILLVLSLGWLAFMAADHHAANCPPGARADEAIEYVARTPQGEFSSERLREMLKKPIPAVCDIAYPTEPHNYGDRWPTGSNLLGLGIYGAILLGLYLWYRWPTLREDRYNSGSHLPL